MLPDIVGALVAPGSAAAASRDHVDVGIGALPHTTLEWASALRTRWPDARVLGIDHEPAIVARAQRFATPGVGFRTAAWAVPGCAARVVRVLNVLRDYPFDAAVGHQARCARSLADGGVLIEGTCGPHGEVGVVHLLVRGTPGLRDEGLLFFTDGSRGAAPILFRDRLPSAVRRSVIAGHPVGDFLAAWMTAFAEARRRAVRRDPLALLDASVQRLGRADVRWLASGVVWWRGPVGLAHPDPHARVANVRLDA